MVKNVRFNDRVLYYMDNNWLMCLYYIDINYF